MEVQSLSIVIPATCPNRCPFCVSHMNKENKKFKMYDQYTLDEYSDYLIRIEHRMEFARDNGTNTLMITSTGEALENMEMVKDIIRMNRALPNPFKWIELQTSGVGLEDAINKDTSYFTDINTISISVVDIFSSTNNADIMKMPKGREVGLDNLIKFLKLNDFNVRVSINLTDIYDDVETDDIFTRLEKLDVDQVTFRKLYVDGNERKQVKWIFVNDISSNVIERLNAWIKLVGRPLEKLPFGAMKYSVKGISTVFDNDCMNVESKDVLKYLIIRENGKLYSRWDDKGSLIF